MVFLADSTFDAGISFEHPVQSFAMSFNSPLGTGSEEGAFLEVSVTPAGSDPVFRLARDSSGWVVSLGAGGEERTPPFTARLRRGGKTLGDSGWGGANGIARARELPSRLRVSAGRRGLNLTWEFSGPTRIVPIGKKWAGDSADAIVISTGVPASAGIDSLHFRGGKVGAVTLTHLERAPAPKAAGSK